MRDNIRIKLLTLVSKSLYLVFIERKQLLSFIGIQSVLRIDLPKNLFFYTKREDALKIGRVLLTQLIV